MKTGRTLQELAAELERQKDSRKDYVAPQGAITAEVVTEDDKSDIVLSGLNGTDYRITSHAHQQFADHLGIPKRYYDRMQTEQPALLVANMNAWMAAQPAEKRMVRTLDGRVRAVMSEKYRPLDNFELAESILPKMIELGVQVLSCELTETRMYIKGILPGLSDDLPAGAMWGSGHVAVAEYQGNRAGKLVAAITISNSEVGAGSLRVEPSVFTTWCTNLAVIAQATMKKYHVGRSNDVADDLSIYRNETRLADDRAFWMKVQDVAAAAFDRKVFEAAVLQIRDAAGVRIESEDLPAVVDMAVKQLALPERTSSGILANLARGGDLSKWGLSSAITAAANTAEDYEVATDLERAGGKVLVLAGRDWNHITLAKSA